MEFSRRPITKDQKSKLYRMRVKEVLPYTLMFAPCYVYLTANEKFLAVKSPLDFFTEEELSRLLKYQFIYCSSFSINALPFRDSGRAVRKVLTEETGQSEDPEEIRIQKIGKPKRFSDTQLGPSVFEVSDAVLRALGPVWWEYDDGIGVEPVLVAIFINEVCAPIPAERLEGAREMNGEKQDEAVLKSSWAVFLVLMAGYCDLEFLDEIRIRVFDDVILDRPYTNDGSEVDELISIALQTFQGDGLNLILAEALEEFKGTGALKLVSRLNRVKHKFVSRGSEPPSIHGKRGLIDVE